ncbi:Os02g0774700 [Oryza sativa Japonica Group]|uniref:Os02g0774700 protein n=1 Tax=Oryza sativa subsp. japonica TaxID=39947 RepID=A0A0P0VQD7_ORYSJ|nr:hypothetical protein EE612_013969 [Oryza sativa]BAS81156.1 Os02g0774700 [Oryza sativa Japonica Group]
MHEWAGYPLRSRRWSVEAPEPGQLIYNDSCNEVMSVGGVWHPSAVGEPQAVPVLSRPPSQPCCPMPRLEHGHCDPPSDGRGLDHPSHQRWWTAEPPDLRGPCTLGYLRGSRTCPGSCCSRR